MDIAVIGAGISGLGAAWALSARHRVTLFDAGRQPGGHAHTVLADTARGPRRVDTGFIVYNTRTYPHLVRLFDALGVQSVASRMSFSVSLNRGAREYAGSLPGLAAQPSNLARPRHWRMVRDLLRFYREVPAVLDDPAGDGETLGAYLTRHGYSAAFAEDHLLPMAAAIWSAPSAEVRAFPMASFVRFLVNHGLLNIRDRPRWYTVAGGSDTYVQAVLAGLPGTVRTRTPVHAVRRRPEGARVDSAFAENERFDQVVFATHADQALALLGADAGDAEREVLGRVRYARNRAVLHTDPTLMPRRRRVWSSWNYLANAAQRGDHNVAVTYWMNSLQRLRGPDVFVSLNPLPEPELARKHADLTYDHPILDGAALAAQRRLPDIQGANGTWFCGAWCGFGFHEDGLESGLAVASALGAAPPWPDDAPWVSPAAFACTPRARDARAAA